MNNKCCSYKPCQYRPELCCCSIGSTEPEGQQGPTGEQGSTGSTGAKGFIEPQGATSPTGPAVTPTYEAFYNNKEIGTATNALPLSKFWAVPSISLTHTPGSSIVTVIEPGIYNVAYDVNSSSIPFGLRINGSILDDSIINPLSRGFMSGWVTIALAVGDTIEIILTEPSETLINRIIMLKVK